MSSGVPQGSVMGPLLFLIFINDLPSVLDSHCLIYADDLKIWRSIISTQDVTALQNDLNELVAWSKKWRLPINYAKCVCMYFGQNNRETTYNLEGTILTAVDSTRDLGVLLSISLKTTTHTISACASARKILGAIRRAFCSLSPTAFQHLFAAHVRPRLGYGGAVTYPCAIGEMEKLEKVQRAATKMVDGLKNSAMKIVLVF
jgi:ribonuclease P/MRP protein subunit RPP40